MKKAILLLGLVVIIASASFAAAAKPAAKPADSYGYGLIGVSLNQIGCPTARLGMGGWALDLGGSLANNGNQTNVTIAGRADLPLAQVNDKVRTYWGPAIVLVSAGGTTTTTLSLLVGAEYEFVSNLSLFADLTALQINSAGGTTTWTIATNSALIYTGGRLYF